MSTTKIFKLICPLRKEKMKKFMKSTVDAVAKVNMKVMNITITNITMIMNIKIGRASCRERV